MRICLLMLTAVFLMLVAGMVHAAPPATQPSKLAAERVEKLKADLKTFTLRLAYSGDEDKPYYRLLLSVPPLPERLRTPVGMKEAQITEEQAKKLIDHLATEGFLDHALDGNRNRSPVEPQGPHYTLSVRVENKGDPVLFEEWLSWDLRMLQRFDGLRAVLEGDAAKSMDVLLGRMAGHREAWKKAAATQPVSSKAVEKDGLQVTVTLPKATFAADESLKFSVQFKNVSKNPVALYDVDWFWGWTIRFEDMARNGPWQLRLQAKVKRAMFSSRTYKPGEMVEVTVDLGKDTYPFDFTYEGDHSAPVPPLKQLHPGKYRLTIDIPLKEGPVRQDVAFWTGTIKTEPVEFEVTDKPATPATQPAAAFDIRCDKKADAVAVTTDADRSIFTITSASGIGGATIERKGDAWPKQLVLRVHLRGLESLGITSGDLRLSASVGSHSGNPRTLILAKKDGKDAPPLTKDSPYWMDILAMDAKNKTINGLPDKDGYFEMVVPKALLDDNASKITISWIDFYR